MSIADESPRSRRGPHRQGRVLAGSREDILGLMYRSNISRDYFCDLLSPS